MEFIKKLPDANEIIDKYPLDQRYKKSRFKRISEIMAVLDGKDRRKLMLVGPCSADREDAVLEYVERLAKLQDKVSDSFIIIPRIYTSKPRSSGTGYKGFVHRPIATQEHDDLLDGVVFTRLMHLHVIERTGLFSVDEMLYPEIYYYYSDLLCYTSVGARSVEDQQHRMVASGLDMPVGMKNPVSGDLISLINAIAAARHSQEMIYRDWFVRTEGNPYSHAILRGYMNVSGRLMPNYHYEYLCQLHDLFMEYNLDRPAVIIDCNHANSGKKYQEQIRISDEVRNLCKKQITMDSFVKGYMIESYLEDGSQMIGGGVYGRSITDPCLGWKKTEQLILELAK